MLNHVEFTIPRGTLTDSYCRDLDQFLCGILGWPAGKTLTLPNPTTGGTETARWYDVGVKQFVVFHEDDTCMTMGTDDHFGWMVDSFEKVDEILEQCKALQQRDNRMSFLHVIDGKASSMDTGTQRFGGFYVKYLLPVYVDINTIQDKG